MTVYRVVEPYQVHVDGVTYGPGERVETTPGAAAPLIAAGWLVEVEAPAAPRKRQAARRPR